MSFEKSVHITENIHKMLKLKAIEKNSTINHLLNDILEKALNNEGEKENEKKEY